MSNFVKTSVSSSGRCELHDLLSLTGAEVSLNTIPAGANVPFAHSHKENEEIYGILEGRGSVIVDGEKIELNKGDWIKITPEAKRQFFAASDCDISFVCIQVKENSLTQYTMTDAVIY